MYHTRTRVHKLTWPRQAGEKDAELRTCIKMKGYRRRRELASLRIVSVVG
jgi:hypothetical protein